MKQPHKHCDLIKAWADGAEIQFRNHDGDHFKDCIATPCWEPETDYRIKPEPKPDVIAYIGIDKFQGGNYAAALSSYCYEDVTTSYIAKYDHTVRLTFDGDTHTLKSAEVIS